MSEEVTAGRSLWTEPHVELTVTCQYGHVVGVYLDEIAEKYPFWCPKCDEYARVDRYPWRLKARVVSLTKGEAASYPRIPRADQ